MRSTNPESQTWVLKLGSSVLSKIEDLPTAVGGVYRFYRATGRLVVVVSAVGNTTDTLIRQAKLAQGDGDLHSTERHLSTLLATGEASAAALVAMALQRAGLPAHALSFEELGLVVRGSRMDADPIHCETRVLEETLARGEIAVVPGFVGVHEEGQAALLGRGGSDLTALCVADALGAECRLIKDVDGLFTSDPTVELPTSVPRPKRFQRCSFEDAERLPGAILQTKAAAYAQAHRVGFSVGTLQSSRPTLVSGAASVLEDAPLGCSGPNALRPLKIGLVGVGVVGGGVLNRLLDPGHRSVFQVQGVGVRRPSERARQDLPWMTAEEVLEQDIDVLVELVGGLSLAKEWITKALVKGCRVVTANKDLVANRFDSLHTLANSSSGTRLHYSAAVGGAAPLLERVTALSRFDGIVRLRGVLNGTSNFVLNRLHAGATESQAMSEARSLGLAETSAERDLVGLDAADKIFLLARRAFGDRYQRSEVIIEERPLNLGAAVRSAKENGGQLRQVASASRRELRVGYRQMEATDRLFNVLGADNALVIQTDDERKQLSWVGGTGAGRFPTTEAVMADLWDIYRDHADRAALSRRSGQSEGSEVCS